MSRRISTLLVLGVVVLGCASEDASQYTRDGKEYGVTRGVFRGRWWSYYERGASYADGKYFTEAEADLKKALQGRSADTWRARTYGLHFVEYFPNRELGIAYYHQDRHDEAEEYLTRSLEQVDTERAHHYLDQVKKAKIASGAIEDATAPAVETSVEETTLIADRTLELEIEASDDVGVEEVKVNGEELQQRGSEEAIVFEEELVLDEGTHTIQVVAKDLADKEKVEEVEVVVDLTGPTIGVFSPIEPTVTDHGTVILEGAAVDKNLVRTVAVGEQLVAETKGEPRVDFDTELPLAAGENTFILAARDVAGNETRSAIKVFQGDPNSIAAKLWLIKQRCPEKLHLAEAGGLPVIDMLLSVTPTEETAIRLKSPVPDQPYRHNRTLRISGEVVAQTQVAKLTINGEPFEDLTGAPKESFNRRIPINSDSGDTIKVAIKAEDANGLVLEKDIEVEIRPVDLNTRESRMPLAVLAFAGNGVDPAAAELLRVSTEAQLSQQKRFRMLDRTRLQDVLTEQQLASALADPNQAIALGQLTNAHAFLVADVFARGEKGLEIKARVISTETSDLVATLDTFIEDGGSREDVEKACDSLAVQLRATYPRLSGEILGVRAKANGSELLVNWTVEDGIPEGAYMLIVHEEEPWVDEDTGEVLEPGEFIAVSRARITKFSSSNTRAVIVEQTVEDVKLEKGMPAITM